MPEQVVRLSVPAEASFARAVRMMAASLAVSCDMNVDEVEDVRMAAEEGFVWCCATEPDVCDITFALTQGQVQTSFVLGAHAADDDEDLALVRLLLSAICDDYRVSGDGRTLTLLNRTEALHG